MRTLVAIVFIAGVGCGSGNATSSPTSSPTTDPQAELDARICAAALTVPWNSPLMTSLTRNPASPIQIQARQVQDAFDLSDSGQGGHPLPEWDTLSSMCVDAGY